MFIFYTYLILYDHFVMWEEKSIIYLGNVPTLM